MSGLSGPILAFERKHHFKTQRLIQRVVRLQQPVVRVSGVSGMSGISGLILARISKEDAGRLSRPLSLLEAADPAPENQPP